MESIADFISPRFFPADTSADFAVSIRSIKLFTSFPVKLIVMYELAPDTLKGILSERVISTMPCPLVCMFCKVKWKI